MVYFELSRQKECGAYWANSSSNNLVGKLLREGNKIIKQEFETLLQGKSICAEIDDQIIYDQLDYDEQAIWSLLLASGYLKVKRIENRTADLEEWKLIYELEITNFEVKVMFRSMVRRWFSSVSPAYDDFMKALLADDLRAMNTYMNEVAMAIFSYFDTGRDPARTEPERFYHGFVLGLLVELADRYVLTSNRESGFGRYDVMLEAKSQIPHSKLTGHQTCSAAELWGKRPSRQSPNIRASAATWLVARGNKVGNAVDDSIIMEFKVQDEDERALADTVEKALEQIEKKG